MATADKETLEALHNALAAELLDTVKNGVPVEWDEEGNVKVRRKASAAELSAATAFLKNNDVKADINDSDAARELAATLAARRKARMPTVSDLMAGERPDVLC